MQDTSQIYIRIDGEELGPLSVNGIKQMVDEGRFKRDDFIRLAEGEVWVQAKNVTHLNALFDEREQKRTAGAFENWIDQVKSGKPVTLLSQNGVVAEKERIRQELAALEEERNRVETEEKAMRAADRLRENEIDRLNEERARIDAEKEQLEMASDELNRMTVSVRRRRLIPYIVSVLAVIVFVVVGIPAYYYGLYIPGKKKEALADELAEKQEQYDKLIDKLEGKQNQLASLELELIEAKEKGNIEKTTEIEAEILKTQKDIDGIRVEIDEATGKTPRDGPASGVSITGKLERKSGTRPIKDTDAQIRAIFQQLEKDFNRVSGELRPGEYNVVVDFSISEKGKLEGAKIIASDFSNEAPGLEKAIIEEIEALRFEPSKDTFKGTYIFEFETD